ncbi:MAG: Aspartate aminotransferase, partial [uncultured Chthoniobacterales bacterium]
ARLRRQGRRLRALQLRDFAGADQSRPAAHRRVRHSSAPL